MKALNAYINVHPEEAYEKRLRWSATIVYVEYKSSTSNGIFERRVRDITVTADTLAQVLDLLSAKILRYCDGQDTVVAVEPKEEPRRG